MKLTPLASLALIVLSTVGCASKFPEAHSAMDVSSAELALAPKDALAAVKRVVSEPPLSLGVQSEDKGTLVTGYQSFPGAWHIGRRWQERTRYRITIAPDWDEPTAKCRLTVLAETDQRAATGQRWDPAPHLNRTDRAKKLLDHITQNAK